MGTANARIVEHHLIEATPDGRECVQILLTAIWQIMKNFGPS